MTRNEILRRFGNCSEAFIKANSGPDPIQVPNTHKSLLKPSTDGVSEPLKTPVGCQPPKKFANPDWVTCTESATLWDLEKGHGFSFTIPGQPVPKPRMTQRDRWMKRPCVMRYREWADKARASVPKGANLTDIGHLEMKAFLLIPKSYSKKKRKSLMGQPHRGRIDGDNLIKSLQDSLLKQDCGIWKFSGEKRWADERGPRMEVKLY